MCGSRPCAMVAKPARLAGTRHYHSTAVSVAPGLLLQIPSGYRQIAHNGTVDVYRYPASGGRKELLLHTTSVTAFGNLGAHDNWRVYANGSIVIYFRQVTASHGWNGFVVYRPTQAHGGAMLELYAIGFPKARFEAVLADIKAQE